MAVFICVVWLLTIYILAYFQRQLESTLQTKVFILSIVMIRILLKLISKCCTLLQFITIVGFQWMVYKLKKAPDMVLYRHHYWFQNTPLHIASVVSFRAYKHSNYHNLEYRYPGKYIV